MIRILFIIYVFLSLVGGFVGEASALEWFEEEPGIYDELNSGTEVDIDGIDLSGFGDMETVPSEKRLVSMKWEFLNHDILKLSVRGQGFEIPILGASFYLKFDPDALAFLRYDPGGFLERGGDPFYLVTEAAKSGEPLGRLIFGETLRRNDNFPIGDGDFVHFYFQEIAPGDEIKYELKFENGVVSTLDTVRQDIDQVLFVDETFGRGDVFEENSEEPSEDFENGVFDTNMLQTSVLASGISSSIIWLVMGIVALLSVSGFYFIKARFY